MKPHITIWVVEFYDSKKSKLIHRSFSFLFRRAAERYCRKHIKEWDRYGLEVLIGGEPLYFW